MAAGINTKGKMQITELDFDNIKSNLKTFLKSQSQYTDYDFEASGMNILLDTLAYNTHYNAFMANMLSNEMFLESAVKRNSVISHAKAIGYTPTSVKAPVAYVKVEVHDANTPTITMPEGYAFTTTIDSITYRFINITERTISASSGLYIFGEEDGIPVYEGTYVSKDYTVDLTDPDQRFLLDNINVDTDTLSVSVQNSSSDTTTSTYIKANNLVDITATTNSFFVQETTEGNWEVYFGDGIVGKAVEDGNIVKLKYVVTNKTEANGATAFTASSSISTFNNIEVTTMTDATGGAVAESLASIKHNAPFSYAAQNRAVTAADFTAILPLLYSDIESVSVWGGEYANPPVYGKVYISIRPNSGSNLTNITKEQIKKQLKDYTVASITPEFLDPVTTKIIPVVNFKYNNIVTNKSSTDLETSVSAAISTFSDNELEKFEGIFRYSKLTGMIDNVDTSILSNITTIRMSQALTPTIDTAAKYTISFNNAFYHPHTAHAPIISSTGFTIAGKTDTLYFDDDGSGNVRTYSQLASVKTYIDNEAGTVDYTTGEIVITSITVTGVSNTDGTITLTVTPDSNDIVPVRNQILEIDTTNMTVTGDSDTIAAGGSNAGTQYSTTSSYA